MRRFDPRNVELGVASMLLLIFALAVPAHAVPSFGRRAGASGCATCHWHQNALNATGKEFLRHGLRAADEKPDVTEQDLRMSHYASLVLNPSFSAVKDGGTKFSSGEGVLWLGGPIDGKFSALAETEFKIDDVETEVEEVYVHHVSSPGSKYFSARAGQFQPLVLLMQSSGPPRLALSRPEVISGKATNGNDFRPRSRLRGVELGAVNGPLSAYLGIGNGTGQNEDDNHMDTYLTVEREIGMLGSSIGLWSYWGEAVLTGGFRDKFNRFGVIGNFTTAKTRVVGAVLFGSNDDPSGADLDNSGWFIEVAQKVQPALAVYARWDNFERDKAAAGRVTKIQTDGPTLGISWIPTQLTRLILEAQLLDTDGTDQHSITAELQAAF